jgi:hypothetical protein
MDGIVLINAPGNMSAPLGQILKQNGPPIVLLDREHAALGADAVVADDLVATVWRSGICLISDTSESVASEASLVPAPQRTAFADIKPRWKSAM